MSRLNSPAARVAIAAIILAGGARANATVLTFLNATGYSNGDYGTLGPIGGDGYGDRVDFGAATSGADAYGGYLRGAGGWTPNVVVDYRSGPSGNVGLGLSWGATLDRADEMSSGAWGDGNDSNGAAIITYKSVWPQAADGVAPEIILTPDPGYAVVLRNFLFEAFDPANNDLDGRSVSVRTASDAVLFTTTEPDGNNYWWNYYGVDGFTKFNPQNDPIVSTEPIRIIGDATWWRSISAIDFGQVAVPEPSTWALGGLALTCLAVMRRRLT